MGVGEVHRESGLTWNMANEETLGRQRARNSDKTVNGHGSSPVWEQLMSFSHFLHDRDGESLGVGKM